MGTALAAQPAQRGRTPQLPIQCEQIGHGRLVLESAVGGISADQVRQRGDRECRTTDRDRSPWRRQAA